MEELIGTTKVGLNLHFDSRSLQLLGLEQGTEHKNEGDWGSPHRKISRLLNSVAAVVDTHFPWLTEPQWKKVLEAKMPCGQVERDFQDNSIGSLLNSLFHEYGPHDPDISAIAELDESAILAITLVANSYFQGGVAPKHLRDVLSETSGRPREAVYSHDPTIDDLWCVREIEVHESELVVHFDYSGSETAQCFVERTSDDTLTMKRVEISSERPLVPPSEWPSAYLFGLALPLIFKKLDELESDPQEAA